MTAFQLVEVSNKRVGLHWRLVNFVAMRCCCTHDNEVLVFKTPYIYVHGMFSVSCAGCNKLIIGGDDLNAFVAYLGAGGLTDYASLVDFFGKNEVVSSL